MSNKTYIIAGMAVLIVLIIIAINKKAKASAAGSFDNLTMSVNRVAPASYQTMFSRPV